MATLVELLSRKLLVELEFNLTRFEFKERRFIVYPQVRDWLLNELPKVKQFYPEDIEPKKQGYNLLKDFVTGKPFPQGEMFRKMQPSGKDIFELRTPDIRVFGWFCKPRIYIAACIDTFEITHKADSIHNYYRDRVVEMRSALPLDEPKCVTGAEPENVF